MRARARAVYVCGYMHACKYVTGSHKMEDKSHFGTIEILYILKEEKILISDHVCSTGLQNMLPRDSYFQFQIKMHKQ